MAELPLKYSAATRDKIKVGIKVLTLILFSFMILNFISLNSTEGIVSKIFSSLGLLMVFWALSQSYVLFLPFRYRPIQPMPKLALYGMTLLFTSLLFA